MLAESAVRKKSMEQKRGRTLGFIKTSRSLQIAIISFKEQELLLHVFFPNLIQTSCLANSNSEPYKKEEAGNSSSLTMLEIE